MDVAHFTTTNALFNAEIKILQPHCVFLEDEIFMPMKVKGDGSCLYQAIVLHIMSCCFNDVLTDRFPPGKKPGIKLAIFEVANDWKEFISQEVNDILKKFVIHAD